jgi:aldose 1-epimerase
MRPLKSYFFCFFIIFSACLILTTTAFKVSVDNDHGVPVVPKREDFQATVDGKKVDLFKLTNKNAAVYITNFGGRVVSIIVPDKNGRLTDVVLGHDFLEDYRKPSDPVFGALIGRFANRIAGASFRIDEHTYEVTKNNTPNSIHGGNKGFHNRVWDAKQINEKKLELTYLSEDGEEGFPGNLTVKVTYTLNAGNSLQVDYTAITDKATVINLTNHTYFNLNGEGDPAVTDHFLQLNAAKFTPVDQHLIPTGELQDVAGTPFDFRKGNLIGARINEDHAQMKLGSGYDHNFVINKRLGKLGLAAKVISAKTGIKLEVLTTEPGVQLYTANHMNPNLKDGKGKKGYNSRSAFCLETQHFPDSPNKPDFPSVILRPGKTFKSTTIFRFSTATDSEIPKN